MKEKKRSHPQKTRDELKQQKWQTSVCGGAAGCIFVFVYYQLPRQEEVLLPCHNHRHTLSQLGATQHGHKVLLAAVCHVYSIHLKTWKKKTPQTKLKWSTFSSRFGYSVFWTFCPRAFHDDKTHFKYEKVTLCRIWNDRQSYITGKMTNVPTEQ